MIDTILIELITLQEIVKKIGYKNDDIQNGLNRQQTMVISGLIKRLFNQLPIKIEGHDSRSEDF